jgi:F-type H+-transporting ATPase subunit gamma
MATLREIKRRIAGVRSTQQITKAMKMVAAAKLRKAQAAILSTRPYAAKLAQTIGHLVAKVEESHVPLLQIREIKKVLIVVVTADRGLCGAFNHNLLRYAVSRINSYKNEEITLFPVGRKGNEFFLKRSYTVFAHKIQFFNWLQFSDASEIVDKLVEAYCRNLFDKIEVIYNEFKSAVRQDLTVEQMLPFVPDKEMIEAHTGVDFLYEPDQRQILNYIIPKHLSIQMWKILLESNAAEQGARMTAMESATENADDLIAFLTLTYNRARQAAITKEISEIVGGAEALKEK